MRIRTALLSLAALLCLAAAYRFASHGLPARDPLCLALATAATALAATLLWLAFRKSRAKGV